ncbi:zinc finger protein 846-like isoform X1 [Scleropages formosus]|nr:zinc finger protein 846-like isoform X1 [Scleropages formosus]XP_029109415.1 zinc finger protein 846-like isoform X1 [Scleropages formosus]XP_029109416.1 zinc finger protein 846-like isoform X1 [Scleropages formosus]XP_029109417.1 zinc finger protein 846-like isoform X1 [Scleropages formosus]XP_029109418.1 zinc finger protein 846-like isoform X1 [Scleropages formosus]
MDCSSSLYMCFPCCQLFSSLEDVLSHQQTCHSDDTKEEAAQAAPSDDLDEDPDKQMSPQKCVHPESAQPSLYENPSSPQQSLTEHLIDVSLHSCSNNVVSSPSQVILNGDVQDNQRQTGSCSDPLIHYQCGDCGSLFDSLAQWQHHRKLGLCAEPAIVPDRNKQVQCLAMLQDFNMKLCQQLDVQHAESGQWAEHIKDMGREGGAGVKMESQPEWQNGEMAVSQDHSYLPIRQGEGEEGQREVHVESKMQGSGAHGKVLERGMEADLGTAEVEITALSCILEEEPVNSQTITEEQKLKTNETEMVSAVTPAVTSQNFLCMYCGNGFSSESALVAHRKTRHGLEEAVHCCPVCKETFMSTTLFLYHRRQHRERQAQELEPNKTAKIPLTASSGEEKRSDSNLKGWSKKAKDLVMPVSFHSPASFVESSSCAEKNYSSTYSHIKFSDQAVLDVHMHSCPKKVKQTVRRGRGRNVELLICDLCGHCCMTQDGLDLHRLSHSGQTPLRCPLLPCRRRFITSSALEDHILTHSQTPPDLTAQDFAPKPRPFHCERCSKSFTTASSLSVHLRIHTGERPYQCTQCGKRFRQIPHLRDHERLHSGVRPFSCEVCGKSFVLAARLAEHARTHSGEKPYTCPLCTRTFRSLSNLGKHRKTHSKSPAHKEVSSTEEGETAVQTILLVQAQPSILQGADQPHLCQLSPPTMTVTSTASSPLVLLHPTTSLSKVQEEQVIPIIQHAIDVIVEETV